MMDREKEIYKVTIMGSIINLLLLIFKFVGGIVGHSAAMIADAVHSLSDFITDIIVLVFVKLSNKPQDKDHDYGHGKYETLATAIIGIALLGVGIMIMLSGFDKVWRVFHGETLASPGLIALIAALLSVIMKEWVYRITIRVGKRVNSSAVIANAWHHRSDSLSSIGTSIGIGGAIILGDKWTILDPIAAIVVSFFIIKAAWDLISKSVGELLEESLPDNMEEEISRLAESEPEVSGIHHLRTRRIGSRIAIDMHIRMPGNITLYEAHQHATHVEQKIKECFGKDTYVNIHIEPLKESGVYVDPRD